MSSDAGGEVDKRIGVTAWMSRHFAAYRDPASVEHIVAE